MATGNVIVSASSEVFIVGVPSNNAAFFDGTRYWVFYTESADLKCKYGTSLGSMSATGGTLVADINNNGKAYACLFGKYSGAWYVWVLCNRADIGQEEFEWYRWDLGAGGLANGASVIISAGTKPYGHVHVSHAYGSEVVSTLYGCVCSYSTPIADSHGANREMDVSDFTATGDTGMGAYDPASLNFPEHMRCMKLSDGYLVVAIDEGDGGTDTTGTYERKKTGVGDAWGAESAELGMTDQEYATNTSHAGQQGFCQLDDGTIYLAYVDDAQVDGDSGMIVLEKRGAAQAGTWANVTADVIGSSAEAWHIALATDGTDVWVFYVKDAAGIRDTAIYYRKYDVSGPTWDAEVKLVDMQGSHTFLRMCSQWRAYSSIVLAWSEDNGDSTYDLLAATVDLAAAPTFVPKVIWV